MTGDKSTFHIPPAGRQEFMLERKAADGEVAMSERDLLWMEGEAQVGPIRQFQEHTMDELRKACRRKAWVVFSYIAGVAAGKSFRGAFQ